MLVTKIVRGVLCLVVLLSISAMSAGPAEGEGVMTEEDTPVYITLIGNDVDGDSLTYNVVTGPSHGRLSGTVPKLTYTPEPNFNGTDSFTFVINDATVDSIPMTVIIEWEDFLLVEIQDLYREGRVRERLCITFSMKCQLEQIH